jgi:dipeptide/tripeptide permease
MEQLWIVLLSSIIAGVIGALIGKNRKIGAGWAFVLGLILGLIGWIIAACSEKTGPKFDDMSKGGNE